MATKTVMTAAELARQVANSALAKKIDALVNNDVKNRDARSAYEAGDQAQAGTWANWCRAALVVGITPEDWANMDDVVRGEVNKPGGLVTTMIDAILPDRHSSMAVADYTAIMNGKKVQGPRANHTPVMAEKMRAQAVVRRSQLRSLCCYFGSGKVQNVVNTALAEHPELREGAGGINAFWGKLLPMGKNYCTGEKPTTEGMVQFLRGQIATLYEEAAKKAAERAAEKAAGKKPAAKPVAKSPELRAAELRDQIKNLIHDLAAVAEGKYLSAYTASEVEKLVDMGHLPEPRKVRTKKPATKPDVPADENKADENKADGGEPTPHAAPVTPPKKSGKVVPRVNPAALAEADAALS